MSGLHLQLVSYTYCYTDYTIDYRGERVVTHTHIHIGKWPTKLPINQTIGQLVLIGKLSNWTTNPANRTVGGSIFYLQLQVSY